MHDLELQDVHSRLNYALIHVDNVSAPSSFGMAMQKVNEAFYVPS